MKDFNSISFSRLSFVSIYLILFILWHWLCAFFAHNSSSSNGKRLHPKTNQSNHPEQTIFVEMQESATFQFVYPIYVHNVCACLVSIARTEATVVCIGNIQNSNNKQLYSFTQPLCNYSGPFVFFVSVLSRFPIFCCCVDLMNFHSTTPHSVIKWLFVAR